MLELFVTDHQVPFHDTAVWKLQVAVAAALKPDILFFGGDFIDYYQLSKFDKDPARALDLQKDLDLGVGLLEIMAEASGAKRKYFLPGNHEKRMLKTLWKIPELCTLRDLAVPKQLRLKEMGYEWLGYEARFKIGELTHIHGDNYAKSGDFPAASTINRSPGNFIFGHHHKEQVAYKRLENGNVYSAWSVGCSCVLEVEYVNNPQWQQGMAIVEYTKSGFFHVNPINIFRDNTNPDRPYACCMVGGKLYRELIVP